MPSIDPVVLFKMIFIGYFYGIRSERQLEKEIKVSTADPESGYMVRDGKPEDFLFLDH